MLSPIVLHLRLCAIIVSLLLLHYCCCVIADFVIAVCVIDVCVIADCSIVVLVTCIESNCKKAGSLITPVIESHALAD
jgi:hypothetical protein